jgi:hypothetical protein
MKMNQVSMPFMRPPNAPAARSEYGREEPIHKEPAPPHREKADNREKLSAIVRHAMQVQDTIEKEKRFMAITNPKDAEETFGEDLTILEEVIDLLKNNPDDKDARALFADVFNRRIPKH